MATVQTNETVMRWLNGGVLKITGAVDTYVVNNIQDGEVSFNIVRREAVHFKDRGVYQAPLEGDDELGECTVEVNCGALAVGAGTSLVSLLNADGSSSSNTALEYATIILDFPVSRGGSTGQRVTLTNCSMKTGIQWTKGMDTDKLKFSFNFRSQSFATY
jgi:hypothetical protein